MQVSYKSLLHFHHRHILYLDTKLYRFNLDGADLCTGATDRSRLSFKLAHALYSVLDRD